MPSEVKIPDALLTQSNLTGSLTSINLDDTTWLTAANNNTDSIVAVSFPTPTGNPTIGVGTQGFTVKYRVTANASSVTFNAYLRESGTRINGGTAIDTWASTSTTEVTRQVLWNANLLSTANGSLVELEVVATKSGGSPSARTTGGFQFIDWDVVYDVGATTFNRTVTGSITSTSNMVRSTNKINTGSITSRGSAVKSITHKILGSLVPIGSVIKRAFKGFASSLTTSGLATTKIVLLKFVSGGVAPSGVPIKMILQNSFGQVFTTGSISKLVSFGVSGVVTLSGSISKFISMAVEGVVTVTKSLIGGAILLQSLASSLTVSSVLSGMLVTPPAEVAKKVLRSFYKFINRR
tara:strand:- start:4530 stop:5582 length:1053 start_codon:yes stop_codon:yes gene_type:complete